MNKKPYNILKQAYFIDYLMLALGAIICIVLFGHVDLYVTAQRALCYVQGGWVSFWGNLGDNFCNFYRNTVMLSGDYGTNYLPTTFLIFAVWNIPLKIISDAPTIWGDWPLFFRIWNMLLPIIIYGFSGKLLLDICSSNFKMDTNKKNFVLVLFWGSPVAFYSQFVFTQYDIFTVFLTLTGLKCYLKYYTNTSNKKNWICFVLSFALAISCKYYVLVIFLLLLVLKEKNIIKIIINTIFAASVCIIEMAFYLCMDKTYFSDNVFGFGVLEYIKNSSIDVGFASIRLLPLFLCFLLVYAYLQHINTHQNLMSQIIFCGCCTCAILFGLETWHPQWLIFAIPFWCLAIISCSEQTEFLLYLDIIFAICFVAFTSVKFVNNADQNLLYFGLLSNLFRYRYNLPVEKTMAKFFPIDSDLLFTVMVAIMVTYCICTYPAKNRVNISEGSIRKYNALIRLRFLCGIMTFVLFACLCIPNLLKQDEYLWTNWITDEEYEQTSYLTINDTNIVQYISGVGYQLNNISITFYATTDIPTNAEIILKIVEIESDEIIGNYVLPYEQIIGRSSGTFDLNGLEVLPEKQYALVFNSNIDNLFKMFYLTYNPGSVRNNLYAIKSRHENEYLVLDNTALYNTTLQMSITGRYH